MTGFIRFIMPKVHVAFVEEFEDKFNQVFKQLDLFEPTPSYRFNSRIRRP